MGRHVGISHSTVQRSWAKNDLKPHITKTFKLSNDPQFEGLCSFFMLRGSDRRSACSALA
jgi:hypothetical protein